jgi:GT2 family glycosyltransferase
LGSGLGNMPPLHPARLLRRTERGGKSSAVPQSDPGPPSAPTLLRGPTYSAIIPATDRPVTLDRCLAAINAAADAPEEVIVIDGPPGMGPAAARNAGAARATGSILVFIDSDVEVHSDAFTRIRATFARDPELAAVFGSYDDLPSLHGVVSTFRNMLHHYVHQTSGGLATTFWAGLGAVRREAFVEVDGFDDWRFRSPSVEDIELGLRLATAGELIRLDPEIQGSHLKHWRVHAMLLTDLLYRGMPWMALMLERGPRAARLNLRGSHGAAAVAFMLTIAMIIGRRPRATLCLAAAYVSINAPFYALVGRRAGRKGGSAAVALLALHNLMSLASAPLGVAAFVAQRVRGTGPRATRMTYHSPPTARRARRASWLFRRDTAPTVATRAPDA